MSDNTKIYIGTSGWSYPKGEGTWIGFFYPSHKINELEYYSQFFNTVEVNSSFYRPPNPGYTYNWARRVPKDFLFTVKLWQKFTHPKMYKEATGEEAIISQTDVDQFKKGIDPLVSSEKLGALLAQFPPSFKNDVYGQQILLAIVKAFGSYQLAVELRHHSWSDDINFPQLLGDNNVSWVHIDEPKFQSSVASEIPQTSDIAYFRFHGRNKEMWWQGNNETRYKYLYSQDEINELTEHVKTVSSHTKYTFAFFNNHWQAYAPRNAVDMMKAIQIPFRELHIQGSLQDSM